MAEILDVTGIGNAIVDVIAHAKDEDLARLSMPKGGMTLIDDKVASALYEQMGPGVEMSGGSVANSVAAVASLGGRAGYIGKVRKDQLGQVFAHDIRATGVAFETSPAEKGPPTARCLILVTPDGQRTMNTYLGACVELGPEDIDRDLVARSKVTYLEGYLWDPPRAKEALLLAARLSHDNGRKVALSLSDAFCVERHRADLSQLIDDSVDILFANESEVLALTQADSFDAAIEKMQGRVETCVLTRGAQGAEVLVGSERYRVDAEPVERVVDTTGAGDLFAAGFLHGYCRDAAPDACARMGAVCAAEIISHYGARPEADLKQLLSARGL